NQLLLLFYYARYKRGAAYIHARFSRDFLFCSATFSRDFAVAKIHFFLLKRKEIDNYFLLKGKIFLSLQLFFVLSPLEKVENRIFCLCNLLIIKSRFS
uniref:hypothetical protein n=1 Tax=Prevotella sp. TaxID=59823 RepID=UPI00402683D1